PVLERAHRDRSRPVRPDAHRQQPVAAADLEHGAKRNALGHGAGADEAGGSRRVSRTSRRKLLSAVFVAFCALSVLIALVPLALVLFFVTSQGLQSLNVAFFTHNPTPVG